jgi:ribosomal protein S18 acetylase RimI-like enzyme
LALAYAQTHPKRCHTILLRGVFLFGHDEVDYFFSNGGTSGQHPEAWEKYVSHIQDTSSNWEYEQTDLLGAYWRRLTHDNPVIRSAAAAAVKEKLATPSILIPNATLEVHYMMNHGFLRRGQLLDGVGVMAEHRHVVSIVHGRADFVCQPKAAWKLVRALQAKGCSVDLEYVTGAGHSDSEPGIIDAIVRSCDRFKEVRKSETTTVGMTTMVSSLSIIVRPLVPADLCNLAPLFGAYLDFYKMKHSSVEELKFLESRLGANDSTVFGAFVIGEDDKIDDLAGFAICHHTYNSLRLSPSWTLHDLFVTPKYRRQKLSSSLLNAVHDHASTAGACEVILSTAHDNIIAQSLYEKNGYVKDDKFRVYSRDLQL